MRGPAACASVGRSWSTRGSSTWRWRSSGRVVPTLHGRGGPPARAPCAPPRRPCPSRRPTLPAGALIAVAHPPRELHGLDRRQQRRRVNCYGCPLHREAFTVPAGGIRVSPPLNNSSTLAAPPARRSFRGRAPAEADDIAVRVLDVEIPGPPRRRRERLDDPDAVRLALRIERLDAVHAGRGVQVLLLTPVPALGVGLGRLLEMELQPVQLTDRVEPLPRLAEGETELLVVGDRARQIVDQELRCEGGDARSTLRGGHGSPRVAFRVAPRCPRTS